MPVSIFGNFYDGRREQRLVYLNDVREKVLKRVGSHLTNQLTLEDVIHEEVIPNITYACSNYKDFRFYCNFFLFIVLLVRRCWVSLLLVVL